MTQVRSVKAANNGDGKTERRKDAKTQIIRMIRCRHPSCLVIGLIVPANLANDATFPFVVMKFLSTILLAPELRHTFLLGSIIYYAEAFQIHRKDLRPSKFERIVHVLACLPLYYPSS